jgi:MFS family permease
MGQAPLLILGLIGMSIGWALLAWTFSHHEQSGALHWLTTTGMWLYIACFAFSFGPVMWLLISEVFPLSVRGLGSSVADLAPKKRTLN